jgi:hypothetical protein
MGCANVTRRYNFPFRIVPERGHGPENLVDSSNKEAWYVFHKDDTGHHLAYDAVHLPPKTGVFTLEAFLVPGKAQVGAWETTYDPIDGGQVVLSDVVYIGMSCHLGPVLL